MADYNEWSDDELRLHIDARTELLVGMPHDSISANGLHSSIAEMKGVLAKRAGLSECDAPKEKT